MPALLTLCTLLITMLLAMAARLGWPHWSRRARRSAITIASLLLAASLLSTVTKWDVTNHRIAALQPWVRLVACQVALVFFTLLRPRLLTSAIAAVLLPMTLMTFVTGQLAGLFRTAPYNEQFIADRYYFAAVPWESGPGGNSGIDFDLFYKTSPTAHFRRSIYGTRLYNSQCQTAATYVTLSVEAHTLTVHCPPLPQSAQDSIGSGLTLRYFIPHGALSPELRQRWKVDHQSHDDEERIQE